MQAVKSLQELRDTISEIKYDTYECLAVQLQESTEFERGQLKGMILAYEEIDAILRNSIKHGDAE